MYSVQDQTVVSLWTTRGIAQARSGNLADALRDLQYASTGKGYTPTADALFYTDRCHFLLGEPVAAGLAIRDALLLDSDYQGALALEHRIGRVRTYMTRCTLLRAWKQWYEAMHSWRLCQDVYQEEGDTVPMKIRSMEVELMVAEGKWHPAEASIK